MNVPRYRGNVSDVVDDYELTFVPKFANEVSSLLDIIGCVSAKDSIRLCSVASEVYMVRGREIGAKRRKIVFAP